MADHLVTIGESYEDEDNDEDVWDVTCSCGFKVETLTSHEAALDTANWHQGKRSQLGDVSGIEWGPDDG